MSRTITSVEGLIRKVFKSRPEQDEVIFYRGHANRAEYKLAPSIFRDAQHLQNEDTMFRELMASNPSDFAEDRSTFEKLVRMQHHSMPTRLLDITSNPLMALYFACNDEDGTTGEVIILKMKKKIVHFFDSDTTSVIANLAHMDSKAKAEVAAKMGLLLAQFNKEGQVGRLLHFIREEKSYFQPLIRPEDIKRIICVKSKMSNLRIVSQAGAFLLFGHGAKLDDKGTAEITLDRIAINGNEKAKLLRELDALNINDSTVFPYIESSARYIRDRYATPPI